jgi:hypothetical protein
VPITTKVVSSNPVDGEVYSIQYYAIKFVSDLRQVEGFLRVLQFPPPIKLTLHLLIKTFGKPGLQLQKEGNLYIIDGLVWFMVFSTIFNNISVISWWSVLLVEETGENQTNFIT